jgi:acetyl esterase/lipase
MHTLGPTFSQKMSNQQQQRKKDVEAVVDTQNVEVTNPQDGHVIACKLWTPGSNNTNKIRAAALFIHGGMFSQGNKDSHSGVSQALVVQNGLAILTTTFRDGTVTTYDSGKSMSDLQTVAMYTKHKYSKLPFGVIGSSSGGFFALKLCQEMPRREIKFCITLCPVSDPLARAIYLKYCIQKGCHMDTSTDKEDDDAESYHVCHEPEKAQYILNNQLQFFVEFAVMHVAANDVRDNLHNVPTLVILGSADANVPSQVTQSLIHNWATRTVIIGGVGHEIQNTPPPKDQSYIPDIERFLCAVLKEDICEGVGAGR